MIFTINNYIKEKYGNKAKLLFTDTDSLNYEIKAERVQQDFWVDRNKFDNSDYPEKRQYFDKTNKNVIVKFKGDASAIPITEFIGLRSKMYNYVKDNGKGGKTANKGVKKVVIKKNIKHENCKDVLFNCEQNHHKMKTIWSNNHQLGSYEINKGHYLALMINDIYWMVQKVMLMVITKPKPSCGEDMNLSLLSSSMTNFTFTNLFTKKFHNFVNYL